MRIKDILIADTGKDGGPESKVDGFWLIRIKSLFTIAFLRFGKGSREVFHNHAFHSISWVLSGGLREVMLDGKVKYHFPSIVPIVTKRNTFHKVYGVSGNNWVFTIRGPWLRYWLEKRDLVTYVLTHNREEVTTFID